MIFGVSDQGFILKNKDSLQKRMTIFFITIAIWWSSDHYLRPLLGSTIQRLRDLFGNGTFVQNIFSQSLPVDIVCLFLFIIFRKMNVIPWPQISRKFNIVFREGFIWGILICIPTIPLALYLGYQLGFSPNWQSILGNIISNSYEEFTYRVFLLSICAYAFRSLWLGILISAILFAAIHTQYPLSMQIIVALASIFFSMAYIRSKSIFSAVLAHQISDMILDSILVQ